MPFLPTIIGIEDAAGARIDARRPDGTRAPIVLRLGEGIVGESTFDGDVTRVTLSIDPEFAATVLLDHLLEDEEALAALVAAILAELAE